jgi:hypothetical protein
VSGDCHVALAYLIGDSIGGAVVNRSPAHVNEHHAVVDGPKAFLDPYVWVLPVGNCYKIRINDPFGYP